MLFGFTKEIEIILVIYRTGKISIENMLVRIFYLLFFNNQVCFDSEEWFNKCNHSKTVYIEHIKYISLIRLYKVSCLFNSIMFIFLV